MRHLTDGEKALLNKLKSGVAYTCTPDEADAGEQLWICGFVSCTTLDAIWITGTGIEMQQILTKERPPMTTNAEQDTALQAARARLATAAHRAPEARTHDDNVFLTGYQLGKIDGLGSALAVSRGTIAECHAVQAHEARVEHKIQLVGRPPRGGVD